MNQNILLQGRSYIDAIEQAEAAIEANSDAKTVYGTVKVPYGVEVTGNRDAYTRKAASIITQRLQVSPIWHNAVALKLLLDAFCAHRSAAAFAAPAYGSMACGANSAIDWPSAAIKAIQGQIAKLEGPSITLCAVDDPSIPPL